MNYTDILFTQGVNKQRFLNRRVYPYKGVIKRWLGRLMAYGSCMPTLFSEGPSTIYMCGVLEHNIF